MARKILLLVTLLLVAVGAICGLAFATKTYSDRAGDVKGGGGPDITSITLSNTSSTLTFRVGFASAPPLRASTPQKWVDMLLIGIDVPPIGPIPASPGSDWLGADFALGTHGPSQTGQLVRLGKKHPALPIKFRIVTQGRTLRFSIPRRSLGNPRSFTFSVAAAREGESQATGGGLDVAPQHGTFRYIFHA